MGGGQVGEESACERWVRQATRTAERIGGRVGAWVGAWVGSGYDVDRDIEGGEALEDVLGRGPARDEAVEVGGPADVAEGDLADLGPVRHHDAATAGAQHPLLHADLGQVHVGDAGDRVDTVAAD